MYFKRVLKKLHIIFFLVYVFTSQCIGQAKSILEDFSIIKESQNLESVQQAYLNIGNYYKLNNIDSAKYWMNQGILFFQKAKDIKSEILLGEFNAHLHTLEGLYLESNKILESYWTEAIKEDSFRLERLSFKKGVNFELMKNSDSSYVYFSMAKEKATEAWLELFCLTKLAEINSSLGLKDEAGNYFSQIEKLLPKVDKINRATALHEILSIAKRNT